MFVRSGILAASILLYVTSCAAPSLEDAQRHVMPLGQTSFAQYAADAKAWIGANRSFVLDTDEGRKMELEANLPKEYRPEHSDGRGILLVHGLGDSPWSFSDIAQSLAANGILVRTVLLPGCGTQPAAMMPDTMSQERRDMIKKYGGEIELTEGKKGMQGAVEHAQEIVHTTPNSILADQFNNPACVTAHYEGTGKEIWSQTEGKTDIFVAAVGTGGTLTGVGKYLKEPNRSIQVGAIEPENSPLLSQGKAGPHAIQGIGANIIPAVLDQSVYDEVLAVTEEKAFAMAKLLRNQENLFVGISSGANVAAAVEIAQRAENVGKNIVTVLPDDGDRYASISKLND